MTEAERKKREQAGSVPMGSPAGTLPKNREPVGESLKVLKDAKPAGGTFLTDQPKHMKELEDPAFLQHLKQTQKTPIVPDDQDYDHEARPVTEAERAHEYRLSQARKLMRLYRVWELRQK
jgi:hypothetical protein